MLLNLNDPQSIVTWWKVLPDQHDVYLVHKLKVSPEFAPAITEAQRLIAGDDRLLELRALAIQRRCQVDTTQAERAADFPGQALRRRELATA